MPSKSKAQHRFMEAVAHGSLKKKGLSPAKAAEWANADKGKVKALPEKAKGRTGGK